MASKKDRGNLEAPENLAERLNLKFTNIHILTRALTHRSYKNENSHILQDNERLEFLGDAVLDFIAASLIFNSYPEMSEGEMTRLRSSLVRTEQLARIARQLNIGPAMRLGRGELTNGGRNRNGLLCATFEAIVGAYYLDSGINAVREFVIPLFEIAAEEILQQSELADPKSRFQEWAQSEKLGTPRYITMGAQGPDHAKQFDVEVRIGDQVYGRGSGSNKQAAAQNAAEKALTKIGIL